MTTNHTSDDLTTVELGALYDEQAAHHRGARRTMQAVRQRLQTLGIAYLSDPGYLAAEEFAEVEWQRAQALFAEYERRLAPSDEQVSSS